ncbi:MFS transporter [Actinokineospora sp.]|uniref:MFS transporter n=1 Tax=Actinokineospora sp. TaxID=1872133 RepID=UPI004037E1DA
MAAVMAGPDQKSVDGVTLTPGQATRLTITLVLTVVVASFEKTATQTLVAAALDEIGGRSFYALVFGASVLAELVAVVLGAWYVNRLGPVKVFVAGALLHGCGLIICGSAPWFGWFLAGRTVQGIGTGLVWVTVYVLIGYCFRDSGRGRVFGFISMGWAIPGTLGPLVAGVVTEQATWRLVLLPVPALELLALGVVWSVLKHVDGHGYAGASGTRLRHRLLPAVLLSAGILAVLYARQLPPRIAWPVLAVAVVVVLVACRPLFPRGAFRFAAGLPTAVLMRGLVAAPWVAVGFLIPLSLVEGRGFSMSGAGLVLSCGIIGYAVGGLAFSRPWTATLDRPSLVLGGQLLQAAGLAMTAFGLAPANAVAFAYVGWAVTGLGANLANTAINVTVLDLSAGVSRSESASAMAIAESAAVAVVTAVAGLALAGVGSAGAGVAPLSQMVLYGCAAALAVLSPLTRRLRPEPTRQPVTAATT